MINLTPITTILGILIPVVIAYISTRHNFRKHPRQEFSEDIDSAREFETIVLSNASQLVKDRIAQKLVVKKNINFIEAKFFYKYIDMELWMERYIEVREFIKPIVDEDNNIIDLTTRNTKRKGFMFLLSYIVLACLSFTPFMFFKSYLKLWHWGLQADQYLILFNLVTWPFILIFLAFICLYKANKTSDADKFLKRFNEESLKVRVND